MDAQIHAAIVGGLIGGATLAVGVVAGEWLQRARNRRAKFEADLFVLAPLLARVAVPASVKWHGPRIPKQDPEWLEPFKEAGTLMPRMFQSCRGFRGASAGHAELRKVLAAFDVLMEAYLLDDRLITESELADLRASGVVRAVFRQPRAGYLDEQVAQYRAAHGIRDPGAPEVP